MVICVYTAESMTNYGRSSSVSEAYTGQCLAKLLTLFLAGMKLGLGQDEATGGTLQLAFGGPLWNKGTPNVFRTEVAPYIRLKQIVFCLSVPGVQRVPL